MINQSVLAEDRSRDSVRVRVLRRLDGRVGRGVQDHVWLRAPGRMWDLVRNRVLDHVWDLVRDR